MLTRDELFILATSRERRTWRGKDIKKMEIPWTTRKVIFTCSNGYTIEEVDINDFWLEGLFMGHCLGLERGPGSGPCFSLRDPSGKPHVTIYSNVASGRCNQSPPERYMSLVREWRPEVSVSFGWGNDNDKTYHNLGILEDKDYRDLKKGKLYRTNTWKQKREVSV